MSLIVKLILGLLTVEYLIFAHFKLVQPSYLLSDPTLYTGSPKELKSKAILFDPLLGWKQNTSPNIEERPLVTSFSSSAIATFGSSFTYGEEVGHEQTWQSFMGRHLQQNVLNFGVGGYGFDQSLLLARQKLPQLQSQHVILGFIKDNLHKALTIYPPFIHRFGGAPAFSKPRYKVVEDKQLELIANPLSSRDDLHHLSDENYIAKLTDFDGWREILVYPPGGPPYFSIFLDPNFWQLNYEWEEKIWQHPQAIDLFQKIMLEFYRSVQKEGKTPHLALFPLYGHLSKKEKGEAQYYQEEVYHQFKELCLKQKLSCLYPAEALKKHALKDIFVRQDDDSHYSPFGNAVVAQYFLKQILKLEVDIGSLLSRAKTVDKNEE